MNSLRLVTDHRLDRPVLPRHEGVDLVLALDDEPERRTLYAAGRQPAAHLLPEQRREIEADEIIERPAGLLGVDELRGELSRRPDRLLDRAFRDLVEHDPVDGLGIEELPFLEDLVDVPGNRFAFTIGVGREVDGVCLPDGSRDLLDVLFVLVDEPVLHGEAVLGVDGAVLRHEIANVPVGCKDLEVPAQIFLDRPRLGGRLDDDQMLAHGWIRKSVRINRQVPVLERHHACARVGGALRIRADRMFPERQALAARGKSLPGETAGLIKYAPRQVTPDEDIDGPGKAT